VLFARTKSNGARYWYGYINPDGAQYACVDTQVTDFPTCRMAMDQSARRNFTGCCDETRELCVLRGWWSTRFDAQLIFMTRRT